MRKMLAINCPAVHPTPLTKLNEPIFFSHNGFGVSSITSMLDAGIHDVDSSPNKIFINIRTPAVDAKAVIPKIIVDVRKPKKMKMRRLADLSDNFPQRMRPGIDAKLNAATTRPMSARDPPMKAT